MLAYAQGTEMRNPILQPIVAPRSDEPMAYAEPRVWYALTVRPGREQDAADWLKRGNVHAYWPCYTRQVSSGRKAPNGRHTSVARLSSVIPAPSSGEAPTRPDAIANCPPRI